ncbi:MAG TPA: hypothetical protein DF383_04415 [Deltaproteobacteria bacterium]|nr:hypothetical protein [Deltaproteobacteria bacterium]
MKKHLYFIEIPVFYLVLFGISLFLFPKHPGFYGVDPNPWWLGVFLFAFRYGSTAGVIAGGCSAGTYLYSVWAHLDRYLMEDPSFYLLPICFVMFGGLIGLMVHRLRQETGRSMKECEKKQDQLEKVVEENKTLQDVNQELERRIITPMSTLIAAYEGARCFDTLNFNELIPAVLDYCSKTLHAEEIAFYLKTKEGWRLKEARGHSPHAPHADFFAWNEGIVGQAGQSKQIVTLPNLLKEGNAFSSDFSHDLFLAAGPVHQGENGPILGVIAIRKMPFLEFNYVNMNLFRFLLNWASRAFGRANYFEQLLKKDLIDPKFNIYTEKYFLNRFQQEFVRSQRYHLPLSVGVLRLDGLQPFSAAEKDNFLLSSSVLLKESLRRTDIPAKLDQAEFPFGVLFIMAGKKESLAVQSRLQANYRKLLLASPVSIKVKFGLSIFSETSADPFRMIEEAKQNCFYE